MAPGTNMGAAHPIQGGGQDVPGDLREKITNDAAAYIASIAKQRGRNDTWVQDAVPQSVSIDAQSAVEQHVADLLAPDLRTLLVAVDGRAVTTASGPATIAIAQSDISIVDPTPVELVAQKVFDPTIAYLLMTIGFFAVLIELFHPGALLPGVSGVVCLVLSFVGFAALPMNWGGVVLIVAAAALFILDIKAAAHGGLTIGGLICFVLGSLLLYSPPPGPPSPTLPDVSVALPALLAAHGWTTVDHRLATTERSHRCRAQPTRSRRHGHCEGSGLVRPYPERPAGGGPGGTGCRPHGISAGRGAGRHGQSYRRR